MYLSFALYEQYQFIHCVLRVLSIQYMCLWHVLRTIDMYKAALSYERCKIYLQVRKQSMLYMSNAHQYIQTCVCVSIRNSTVQLSGISMYKNEHVVCVCVRACMTEIESKRNDKRKKKRKKISRRIESYSIIPAVIYELVA